MKKYLKRSCLGFETASLLFWPYKKENFVTDRFVAGGFLCYFHGGKQQNKNARQQGPTKAGTKGALTNLNKITSKRGATAYTTATKDDIILERRKELMFEGFRWDDLMRTGKPIKAHGTLMELLATHTYPNKLFAYPIPAAEINANSNIIQNDGY